MSITIPEGVVWQYKQTLRAGRLQHTWLLNGDHGGIHVDAWVSAALAPYPAEWMGEIECHTPCGEAEADHKHCWVLHGPCKHDGSSLQFSEQIAPWLPYPEKNALGCMDDSAHEMVLSTMLNRYRTWLKEPAEEAKQEQSA